MCPKFININIGLLGHVDCGKTSLAKCLSQISSTAAFDKHPQSQERGITIDLGFSCFTSEASESIKALGYDQIQFTLVDCPGHATLIRTIIGGINIIDVVVLVVDINKGVQTQTAECLIIAEITKKPLLVVLNKIDLIDPDKRESFIRKVQRKMEITLSKTHFYKDIRIIPVSAKSGYAVGIDEFIKTLRDCIVIPERHPEKPLVFSIDHCFSIRGKGTIMTGTVLQGMLKTIEIPELKVEKKIKSIQMFRQNVISATQGDRIGVCVKQFDPKLVERGLASSPGYVPLLYGAIIDFNKVKYFKFPIISKAKFHITLGYETVNAKITLFNSTLRESFAFENDYAFLESYFEEEDQDLGIVYALLEFDKEVYIPPSNKILIGSKLDMNIHDHACRIAYYGNMIFKIYDKNYKKNLLPRLKIFKVKHKTGIVCNVFSENEVIGWHIFQKETKMHQFVNLKVTLSTGESGVIICPFGSSGKIKINIPESLKPSTHEILLQNKKINSKMKTRKGVTPEELEKLKTINIFLKFKKYIYDKEKKIIQDNLLQ